MKRLQNGDLAVQTQAILAGTAVIVLRDDSFCADMRFLVF